MVLPPDHGKTLDAFRAGKTDFLEQQKRDLLQEAGGLAAAGNMAGARNKLYSGGNFDQAGNVSQEMRAQSAEQRAIQSHARSLDDMKLAKAAKSHELLGNMGNAILKSSNPQAALEQAKTILGQRGLKVENITIDQLPMLMQQNISAQDAFKNEMQERQFKAEEAKTQFAQRHTDRSFSNELDQQRQAQANSDRTFLAGREDAAATGTFRELQQRLLMQRAQNQAAKQAAPKPLTEGQSTARYFSGMMDQAEPNLGRFLAEKKGNATLDKSPPVSSRALSIYLNAPNWARSPLLNKEEKQYLQAADAWIRAKLRKESGASIPPEESIGEFKAFIPLSDDDAQTRKQKNEARKAARSGFDIMGGVNAPGAPDAAGSNDLSEMSDEDLGAMFQ
jgi:hypothetical protein